MSRDVLRDRVSTYLSEHHTMTLATVALPHDERTRPKPHAACVFYAVDGSLRLIFISKPSSAHGIHIGEGAPVAVTVTEQYADWEAIQGVQLWGDAQLLKGATRVAALATYLTRFPFVRDMMTQPKIAELVAGIGVYRVTPRRLAFTDNTTGVFGREVLELEPR